jgi:UDP-2,3-diacylglucosamine hydrolase
VPTAETLFISDLHLSPQRPATIELFLGFLAGRARRAERLYILGDLFDAWIGDDDDAPPHPAIIAALRSLSDKGTEVLFQHGNRDFLIGRRFAKRSGCHLLDDPVTVDLYGRQTLLMHGDLLCTDDVPYQKFRRKARNPWFQKLFLLRSLKKRRRIAADYRRRSGEAVAAKAAAIMDVNQGAVEGAMRQAGVDLLIHGHTHRPARHAFALDGKAAVRWVLSDWQPERGEALRVTPGLMETLSIEYQGGQSSGGPP